MITKSVAMATTRVLSLCLLCAYFPWLASSQTQYEGLEFNPIKRQYRWIRPLDCTINNIYTRGPVDMAVGYTARFDQECCHSMEDRNRCCMEVHIDNAGIRTTWCRCSPVTTCGLRDPVTPTKPEGGTTKLDPPFCPKLNARTLNSEPIANKCGEFPGVFSVVRITNGQPVVICNAVHTLSVVGGVIKDTLATVEFCAQVVRAGLRFGGDLRLQVTDTKQIKMSEFTNPIGHDGAAFFDYSSMATAQTLGTACNAMACGLRVPEMTSRVNYDDCTVVSYGSYDESTLSSQGLRKVAVRISPQSCRGIRLINTFDTMCFASRDYKPVVCSGDYGAPVFCKTVNTGEQVVVGMVAGATDCGKSMAFRVVNFPTY